MATGTTPTSEPVLKGSCFCGRVQLISASLPKSVTLCHCKQCQKMGGGAFLPFGDFENEDIAFKSAGEEEPLIKAIPSEFKRNNTPIAYRGHCGYCGSPLFMKYHCRPDVTSIAMGIIDNASVKGELPKPCEHIFLKEKACWWNLGDDGLARYDGNPEEFDQSIEEWAKNGSSKRRDVE